MLNMQNLEATKTWAVTDIRVWDLDKIIATVAFVAFDLFENRYPRNLEKVISEFRSNMVRRSDIKHLPKNFYYFDTSLAEVVKIVEEELVKIKEFRRWNLTDLEYENGVDPDDDTPNEWWKKSDKRFIDLTAFQQNVYCCFRGELIEDRFFEGELIMKGE